MYNGLRRANALPGDVVAVQGIGGLGHLAIQVFPDFNVKMVKVCNLEFFVVCQQDGIQSCGF